MLMLVLHKDTLFYWQNDALYNDTEHTDGQNDWHKCGTQHSVHGYGYDSEHFYVECLYVEYYDV